MTRSHSPTELTYDFPLPSSSSTSNSPSSPSFFLTKKNRQSNPYHPSTRAADIARLLDPSYTRPASPSSASSANYGVYVDHHGRLHDPDYRAFPLLPSSSSTSSKGKISPRAVRPPRWLEGSALDEEDEEEGDEQDEYVPYPGRGSPFYRPTQSRYAASPRRYTNASTNTTYTYPYSASSSTSTSSADPTYTYVYSSSPVSDHSMLSYTSDEDEDGEEEHRGRRHHKIRKPKRPSHTHPSSSLKAKSKSPTPLRAPSPATSLPELPSSPESDVYDLDEEDEDAVHSEHGEEDEDPATCTGAHLRLRMRREWQALSLRLRFGVWRVRRRVKRVASR